jgi:hypothetical protein
MYCVFCGVEVENDNGIILSCDCHCDNENLEEMYCSECGKELEDYSGCDC